ncbi:MAG: hypothetical protein HY782_10670 [Chloroflexi bacterium]|nr:hypothetical protein [Chloroflexota bacterium]
MMIAHNEGCVNANDNSALRNYELFPAHSLFPKFVIVFFDRDRNQDYTRRMAKYTISLTSAQSFYVGDSADFEEEIKTTRANKKLMRFLEKRCEHAKKQKLIPIEEVEKRLGLRHNRR